MDYETPPDLETPEIAACDIPSEIEKFRKKMFKAAEDLDFEQAAELRDRIIKLEEKALK
jgi:excinuclease UvrABC helicase subunit UvrB